MLFAALPLFGCSYFSNNFGDTKCPSTDIAGETATVTQVRGTGGNYADLMYKASLGNLKGSCDVEDDGVTVNISVTTLAEIGPAASDRNANFPYFVAVIGPDNRIITKRVLDNNLTFAAGQSRIGATDQISQQIPYKDKREVGKYHVYLGFQLNKDELAYNRLHSGS